MGFKKVFLLILANEIVDSAAQILMKNGLSHAGSFEVYLGVAIYALNFFVWIAVLSQIDLSLAVPLTSVNYVMLPVLAIFFLHEKISAIHWFGIGLVVFGVYLVSKKPADKNHGVRT